MADKRIIEQTATSEVFVDDWLVKDSSTEGTTKIRPSNLKDYIAAGLVPETMVADEYVTTSTYDSGDICIYEGVLYKALEDDITGDWDSTKWDAITISSELENSGTGNVADVYVNGVSVVDEGVAEITVPEDAEDIAYDNTTSHAQATNTQSAIDEAFSRTVDLAGAISSISASPYSTQHSYHVGDYAMYDYKLYRCISDTSGAWDSTKWEEVKLSNEVEEETTLREELESVTKVYGTPKNLPQAIATFTDGANLPMPSLKVSIEPIQSGSGDPSPTNIRPISGWSGANVTRCGIQQWDEEWELDANYRLSSKKYIPVKPNTENIFCNTYLYSITAYDENKNSLGSISLRQVPNVGYKFTTPSNCYFIKFKVGNSYGTTYNNDISINYPSTDTAYHAYNGHTYTTTLKDGQGNPMTCYGGTLSNENGVQTLDNDKVKKTFDGTENWVSWASVTASDFVGFSVGGLTGVKGGRLTVMCNQLKSVDGLLTDNNCYIANGILYVCISKTVIGGDTLADFKTYLASNNLEIIYPLATPQQIPQDNLTIATQEGVNNVWGDCGQIKDLKYVRNLNITINDLISRVSSLEG